MKNVIGVHRTWLVPVLLVAVCCVGDVVWAQPVNDNCVDAIPIMDGATAFDTTGANTDGPVEAGCKFDGQTYQDIWYTYTATCSGNLTVSTCSTAAYDSDMVVYDGCDCGSPVLLGCNDDGDGCGGFSSEVTVPVIQGNCYLVRIGGFSSGDQGSGTVSLSCTVPGQGSCCHPDDTCTFGSIDDCLNAGGDFTEGGVCAPNPCIVEGACCLADDTCTFGTLGQCVDAGGDFSEGILCDPNPCLINGPDIVYNDVGGIQNHGVIGGIRAYSLGSHTCNIGDVGLEWANDGTPGLAMNAYRLNSGRLEQIGMSWVKHACCVANTSCGGACSPSGIGLRAGCRDVYSAGWNSGQGRLGARSDINPFAGTVPPSTGGFGDAIYKRLQITQTDLEQTAMGALYFVEGTYICTDDAIAGNDLNNSSYKRVNVDASFNLIEVGAMQETIPAIYAWQDNVPSVQIVNADIPGEGRLIAAGNAVDNGNGTWRYTYAVYNINSHRSGGSLNVPVPPGTVVTNIGFNDVDYHSGEPYDLTDWTSTVDAAGVTWSSPETFAQNANSNALRWGTMYTFWFDAAASPVTGNVNIGLFRPGVPNSVTAALPIPQGGAKGTAARPEAENFFAVACNALDAPACVNESFCVPQANGSFPGACYVPKNRTLSIAPNAANAGSLSARRVSVETTGGPVALGWVGAPAAEMGLDNALVSSISPTPVFRDWALDGVTHLIDCHISTGRTYLIEATIDGVGFSPALALKTTVQWGDVVGSVDAGVPGPPQGVANLVDAQQIVKGFQDTNTAPKVWLELQPPGINLIVNLVDAQQAVKGFQGDGYFDQAGAQDPCECAGLSPCPN